jgi:hypothetical protein
VSTFNRRQLLRGLSALSVISAVGGLDACNSGPKYLNVVIHGLSALIVQPPSANPKEGISLFCPEVVDSDGCISHSYLCGSLSNAPGNATKDLITMPKDYAYKLVGVKAGTRPTKKSFDSSTNIFFETKSATASGSGKRTFTLPWPASVASMAVMERIDGQTLLTDNSPSHPNRNLYWASTISVLVYEVEDTPQIIWDNKDLGWKPGTSSDPQFANLHIFAEPKKHTDSTHAIGAFKTLMSSLAIPEGTLDKFVSFNPCKYVRQLPDPIAPRGLRRDLDLQHLRDLSDCPSPEAGELANCLRALVFVG